MLTAQFAMSYRRTILGSWTLTIAGIFHDQLVPGTEQIRPLRRGGQPKELVLLLDRMVYGLNNLFSR